MKWYSSAIKRIGKGIVLFLLPTILLVFIFEKAVSLAQGIIQPIQSHLPTERVLGVGMFSLLSLLLILLLCYVAGMLADTKWIRSFLSFIEDNLLAFIPGYTMMKSAASENVSDSDTDWKVVTIRDDDDLIFGIEVDKRHDGYSMIFIPAPPDAKSGEMKLMKETRFKRVDLSVNKLVKLIRNYGHGSAVIPK